MIQTGGCQLFSLRGHLAISQGKYRHHVVNVTLLTTGSAFLKCTGFLGGKDRRGKMTQRRNWGWESELVLSSACKQPAAQLQEAWTPICIHHIPPVHYNIFPMTSGTWCFSFFFSVLLLPVGPPLLLLQFPYKCECLFLLFSFEGERGWEKRKARIRFLLGCC